jgi:glycosyltransferase involved in cell wall biosynthesis
MKIAIVAPSPVPFVMGGAEGLWLSLQNYINDETPHSCELIKLPAPEGNLLELVRSYRRFTKLNLDHFDQVITGKYPAWMIEHRCHSVYMLHKIRGLYDLYHLTNQPVAFDFHARHAEKIHDLIENVRAGDSRQNIKIETIFDVLEEYLTSSVITPADLKIPGPLARYLIQFLDSFALHPERIRSYFAISETVKKRENYFPAGVDVTVFHPPARKLPYYCETYKDLFTVSRLTRLKRVNKLIEAMSFVESDIKLYIAGTGPEEARLRAMASNDSRIIFLGDISTEELLKRYATALAVPFIPYDEDYGLVALEAMLSSKPVITTNDAGGVKELVESGETGLVVAEDKFELAAAIDYFATSGARAEVLGVRALEKARQINWSRTRVLS